MRNYLINIVFGALVSVGTIQTLWAADPTKHTIVIGTTVGDFGTMVQQKIKPLLEQQGYKVRLVEFTDYVRPNIALQEGDLDVNVFQHKPYLTTFVKQHKLTLVPVFQVPTAPFGLYPGKLTALNQVRPGATVAVPNDPSNLARALALLSDLGWIKRRASANPLTASEHDIEQNIAGIKLIPLEAAQLPRARKDVDYAIINGNYATSAGLKLSEALYQEQSYAYINWGAMRRADVNTQWAKDVVAAYNSAAFKTWVQHSYPGYKLPANWQ